jgi:hypothetical protein
MALTFRVNLSMQISCPLGSVGLWMLFVEAQKEEDKGFVICQLYFRLGRRVFCALQ